MTKIVTQSLIIVNRLLSIEICRKYAGFRLPVSLFISQFWLLPKILSSAANSADILFNWIQNGGTPFRLRMRARTYICCVLSPTHGARWERRADGDDDCDGARLAAAPARSAAETASQYWFAYKKLTTWSEVFIWGSLLIRWRSVVLFSFIRAPK